MFAKLKMSEEEREEKRQICFIFLCASVGCEAGSPSNPWGIFWACESQLLYGTFPALCLLIWEITEENTFTDTKECLYCRYINKHTSRIHVPFTYVQYKLSHFSKKQHWCALLVGLSKAFDTENMVKQIGLMILLTAASNCIPGWLIKVSHKDQYQALCYFLYTIFHLQQLNFLIVMYNCNLSSGLSCKRS